MKRLVLIGCAHIGAKAANTNLLAEYVKLAEDKDTYLLILGDLFENAIPARGEGMGWEQDLLPDEQIDEAARILFPVRDKIIGAVTSNHSERSYKEVGINLDRRLYKQLGIASIYKELEGVVMFEGKKIAFAHGNGHGVNAWGDAKKLFAIYPTADIVCVSHRHEMTAAWHGNFSIDRKGARREKFVLFARTGGLMTWARYAKRELYTPQKPGFTILHFLSNGVVRADINGL